MDIKTLNASHLDAIREIGNIGAGHAATALSTMLGCPVEIDIPKAELVSIYELDSYYDNADADYCAVFASSDNDGPFNFMLLIKNDEVADIVTLLVAKQFGMQMDFASMPEDMVESALGEIGNILLGSFLNSVNTLLGMTSGISTPSVSRDMLGSILSVVATMYGQYGDVALVTKSNLNVMPEGPEGEKQKKELDASILIACEPKALEALLKRLGIL
ncbi:chemotaxis protein CheC [Synergistales bacterium]|nr:chemotaxis protein CheC [Synergistales bacterium]